MGLAPSKYSPKNQKWRFSFEEMVVWDVQVRRNLVILGVNGVAMDRYGLILGENEATGVGKGFRYLRGLRDTIKFKKGRTDPQIQKSRILPYIMI